MRTDDIINFAYFITQMVIVVIAMVYMIAHFAHPNDTEFGKKWYVRILVFIGFVLSFCPLILVHLDVTENKRTACPSTNIYCERKPVLGPIWLTIILLQSMFVWIISPLLIMYYQSNENRTFI